MAQVSPRILVVDDEPALCKMMERFLTHLGYETQSACSPGEALATFKESSFDLVLMDLLLPGMTGQELAPHLKSYKPSTPVVLISAFPPESLPGVDYIYAKPISPGKLRLILETILGTNEQQAKAA
jgi:CheY-like chemotaxis protein